MDPVLIEVLRGDRVESRHRGALVVADAAGGVVRQAGDIDAAVFPRSAVKALQALPLVEDGAADRLGLTPAELALACASHSGEVAHIDAVSIMLAKAGAGTASLECGTHWPSGQHAARALAASGHAPSALHNNCSGKHAGFLCLACAMGVPPAGYVRPEHPVMRAVTAALADMTGTRLDPADAAVDGCSIPTYAIPLRALATGFARFATGQRLAPDRAQAAQRLRQAVAAHPFMVAGTGRYDTRIMQATGIRAFVKTGAEGVYCGALPGLGLGFAIKCGDGAGRAAEVAAAALVAELLGPDDPAGVALRDLAAPTLTNWNGIAVGAIRATLSP